MGDRNHRLDTASSSSRTSHGYRDPLGKFDGNRSTVTSSDGIMRQGDPGYEAYMADAEKRRIAWYAEKNIPLPGAQTSSAPAPKDPQP